ncbi:hypothetical protein ACM66Z_08950 [Sulfurovum sp. ST-21]|uniref:Tetratricopeptide repeat-like domain-containing protein n=1 Tax=Sulfurovum indicum TaxID=2779528 RepID=A0A7M1S2X6_9BACT|nr:hypothetical protein [Sulfurovum indicum]QOR61554.1 hypothetical protein IMZ28_08935 [Sulfurovum indicum]
MSIKDDVKYVKTELSGDEKVLESAFKLESLYKKYKIVVWGAVGAALLFFVVTTGWSAVRQSKLEAANQALLTLQNNPNDTEALSVLKENNPALHEVYIFSQAAKTKDIKRLAGVSDSKNDIIADMSRYTVGAIEKKPVDSKLYTELVYLEEAYIEIKAGDMEKAKSKLALIDGRSSLSMLAKLLEHSTLKGK